LTVLNGRIAHIADFSPFSAEEPADGDGLEEADPEEGHARGGVEVHQLEEEDPALGAHRHTQRKQ
jgi:hypothetical protein